MDKVYADAVRLLLQVAPDVFDNSSFALKGGTAINLFIRDMPRLSVDLDVVYTSWQAPREQALAEIANELEAICARVTSLGLRARQVPNKDREDTKLLIESAENQVGGSQHRVPRHRAAARAQGLDPEDGHDVQRRTGTSRVGAG